jgi:dsRNA-specific ribonuclease
MQPNFGKDKTSRWEESFPERNGVKPNLKLNRNFDNETLYYATKAKMADLMTLNLVKRMKGFNFLVVEVCAGIGGMTTALLENKKIKTVVSYERNSKRRLWLKRNINSYNLGDKAIVPDNIPETGLEASADLNSFKGGVFYFDPPWLPADFVGGKDVNYKKAYIKEDMKVGNSTLEEWLIAQKDTAYMMVFHLPAKYKLKEVPGWTYEKEDIYSETATSLIVATVYYCYNSRISGVGPKTKFGGYKDFKEIKSKLDDPPNDGGFGMVKEIYETCHKDPSDKMCKMFVKYGFEDPEPSTEVNYVDSIPKKEKNTVLKTEKDKIRREISSDEYDNILLSHIKKTFEDLPKPTSGLDKDSSEWIAEFQSFIVQICSKFMLPDQAKKLVASEYMPIWISTFTQKLYDSTNNNEGIETVGDKVLGAHMVDYLYQYFKEKGIDTRPSYITNVQIRYVQKKFLGKAQFNVAQWLRLSEGDKLTKSLSEDTIESFIGALYLVGNKINYGTGFVLTRKVFNLIFENVFSIGIPESIYIDLDRKSYFNQIFERLGIEIPKIKSIGTKAFKKEFHYRLEFTDETHREFIKLKPGFPKIIAEGKAIGSENDAKNETYKNAYEIFIENNITNEWATEIKEEMFFGKIAETEPDLTKQFKNKLRRNGYISENNEQLWKFDRSGSVQTDKYRKYILLGIKFNNYTKKNESDIIAEGSGETDREAKINTMKNYLYEQL